MGLRNALPRRNHKERSQPAGRQRYGFLEKHKDYVQRARDHHAKRDKLQRMRQKAADRNRDEFYHGMLSSKTERGVHIQSRGNEPLPNDVVALLKTQDAGYLRKQLVSERKRYKALVEQIAPRVPGMRMAWLEQRAERVESLRRAGLLGSVGSSDRHAPAPDATVRGFGKKTMWVDSVDELKDYTPAAQRKREKALRKQQTEEQATEEQALAEARKTGERQLSILLRELHTRQRRLDALEEAAQKLDVVRSLMSTKGSHAAPKQMRVLKDAVAQDGARLTAGGLVVDREDDEEAETRPTRTKKQYKWSNERKK